MSRRLAFLDTAPGEARGVVTVDGRPERLLLRRDDDDLRLMLGARHVARVSDVEPALATAFLELEGGAQAVLPFRPDERPVRGAAVEVEVRSEPRRDKLAAVRWLGAAEGSPRLIAPPPQLAEQLLALAPDEPARLGSEARAAADEAEAEAFEVLHPLPGGGSIAIEPTRALTAIDVDLGTRKGADAKRVTRQTNLAAVSVAARLLRLKGLGGLVVIDLAGRGHDGTALLAAARAAFVSDNPGVAFGPISRFGTLELTIPRRTAPVLELLCDAGGGPSDRTLAQRLIRRVQSEAEAQPGARLVARCAPHIAVAAQRLAPQLAHLIGARFVIEASDVASREQIEVVAR
jgi:Ribonuclease G/E